MSRRGGEGEHSPFVAITINLATWWIFEHGYAKEAARYFQTAGNSFRTMLKKPPCRCILNFHVAPFLQCNMKVYPKIVFKPEAIRPASWYLFVYFV